MVDLHFIKKSITRFYGTLPITQFFPLNKLIYYFRNLQDSLRPVIIKDVLTEYF